LYNKYKEMGKKKTIIYILVLILIPILILILQRVSGSLVKGFGGLQITTNVAATVFLDGKNIGKTPLCRCTQNDLLVARDYLLEIVPEDKSLTPFSYRIKIQKNLLTVVDRTFLPNAYSSGFVLTFEKTNIEKPQLLVESLPDSALVFLDSNPVGVTPLLIKDISASEHELVLNKTGFSKKILKVRTIPNHKLIARVFLGAEFQKATPTPTLAPAASESAKIVVVINNTPTGFLRVREGPGTSYKEISKVKPGEKFPYLGEENGWYKIELQENKEGFVSASFSTKTTLQENR
jgi:hypothetical protein